MTVDIIIPTYKPDETLCLLLHKLQGQTFVVHRVIILNTEEELWKQATAAYPIEQVLKELPCMRYFILRRKILTMVGQGSLEQNIRMRM